MVVSVMIIISPIYVNGSTNNSDSTTNQNTTRDSSKILFGTLWSK